MSMGLVPFFPGTAGLGIKHAIETMEREVYGSTQPGVLPRRASALAAELLE